MFVWRAAAAAAGLSRSGSHQGCPVCFLPRVIYSCGGGLHVGSINAQRFFTKGGKIKKNSIVYLSKKHFCKNIKSDNSCSKHS